MSEDTLSKLQSIVGFQLGIEPDKVKLESDFSTELGADSLDIVELVMAIEEAFEIDINDDDAGSISTVQDALDYVKRNQQS
jgi:acyl carrier protein